MQGIICTAGPHASHDLARKNTKFTMKLSDNLESSAEYASVVLLHSGSQSNLMSIQHWLQIIQGLIWLQL